MYMLQKRIQNPVKHLSCSFLAKIVNGFQLLTTSEQSSILDFWQGSEYTYFSFRDTSIIEPKCCFRKRKWIISCQKDKLFSHSLFPSSSFFIIKIMLRGSRRESRICDIRRFFMRYSMQLFFLLRCSMFEKITDAWYFLLFSYDIQYI